MLQIVPWVGALSSCLWTGYAELTAVAVDGQMTHLRPVLGIPQDVKTTPTLMRPIIDALLPWVVQDMPILSQDTASVLASKMVQPSILAILAPNNVCWSAPRVLTTSVITPLNSASPVVVIHKCEILSICADVSVLDYVHAHRLLFTEILFNLYVWLPWTALWDIMVTTTPILALPFALDPPIYMLTMWRGNAFNNAAWAGLP